MARERRSKKAVIEAKIAAIEDKVAEYEQKIEVLANSKADLQTELDGINEAEKQAAEAAQMKEVLKLIKAKNLSVDELKEIVEHSFQAAEN